MIRVLKYPTEMHVLGEEKMLRRKSFASNNARTSALVPKSNHSKRYAETFVIYVMRRHGVHLYRNCNNSLVYSAKTMANAELINSTRYADRAYHAII